VASDVVTLLLLTIAPPNKENVAAGDGQGLSRAAYRRGGL